MRAVFVAGHRLVDGGRLVRADADAIYAAAERELAGCVARAGLSL